MKPSSHAFAIVAAVLIFCAVPNIPAGRCVVRATNLGYSTHEGEAECVGDTPLTVEFTSTPSVNRDEEVVITGQRSGQVVPERRSLDASVEHALSYAEAQLRRTVRYLGDTVQYPRTSKPDGSWTLTQSRAWTSGFFPGSLWYLYEHTRDPFFKSSARKWTEGLRGIQHYGGSHDVGFIVFNSFGNGYRLEPSDDDKQVILRTAHTLMTRYHPAIGCIKSWDWSTTWRYPVIIDNMMNLELLFWSAENGGSPDMRAAAMSHATNTMLNHVRPDGSTYHVVNYDTTSGGVIARFTHQGYTNESAWSRGQAWAIYGFTMTYRFTKDETFLRTAERVADYFIERLPADGVPYWDFDAPGIPNEERDASAAAIAASALFELSTFDLSGDRKSRYRNAAEHTLGSLCEPPYLAEGTPGHSILLHATGSKPGKSEVDAALVYADYYFIEALLRYRQTGGAIRLPGVKAALSSL